MLHEIPLLTAESWWSDVFVVGVVLACITYVTAVWFAWVEIEIEGEWAWAKDNPHSWRVQLRMPGKCGICGNGLPLTGYHLTQFTTVLAATFSGWLAIGITFGETLNISRALVVGAVYTQTVLIEDNAWYVYNMEFARAVQERGIINPFGGFCNRIGRYVVNIALQLALWFGAFLFRAMDESVNASEATLFAFASWVAMQSTVAVLLLVERLTLVPLYRTVRSRLVLHSIGMSQVAQNSIFSGETALTRLPSCSTSLQPRISQRGSLLPLVPGPYTPC